MAIKQFCVALVCVFTFFLVGCADDSAVEVTPEPAPQESVVDAPLDDTGDQTSDTEVLEPVVVEEVVVEEQVDEQDASQAPLITSEDQVMLEKRVYFGFDQYSLSPEAENVLRGKLAILQNNPSVRIQIQGYCDERGTQEYNLALGERRALAVYNFFVQNGIDPSRLETISYGKLFPAAEGSTPQAHALNRRVQTEIIK